MKFFTFYLTLTPKAYGPDGVPPIVLKNFASALTPCLAKLFLLLPLLFLLAGCTHIFSRCATKGDRSNPFN